MKNKDFQTKIILEVEKKLKIKLIKVSIPPLGMDSDVFFAMDDNRNEYAIKYGGSTEGDVLAYKLLKENKIDIPMPKVFGTFLFKKETVIVLEKINFPLLETVPLNEKHRYIPSMIENLKKIHKIKSNEAEFLKDLDRKISWKEVMLAKFTGKSKHLNWKKIASREGLDAKLILQSVENIIKKIEKMNFIDNSYSLLHTDFNQKNLFVDPNSDEIAAIIDWGEATFGDPIYDFARVRMYIWYFNLENNALKTYEKLLSFSPEQKQLEELYWLSRVIEYLAYYSEELNDFNVGRIKLHQDFLRSYNWEN